MAWEKTTPVPWLSSIENHWDDVKGPLADSGDIRAFQMCVWEIAFDIITIGGDDMIATGDLNLGAGGFQTSDTDSGTAQNWLDEITDNVIGGVSGIAGLRHLGKQDQMIAVPLPAPAMLAGLGLIGLVAGRKRLQKLAG